ncbi:hypothetical protein BOVA604_4669 [Bacteroides ovatus]|nr:hypothetical protein BOVA604_4669 [Bacteroides ovatus]
MEFPFIAIFISFPAYDRQCQPAGTTVPSQWHNSDNVVAQL